MTRPLTRDELLEKLKRHRVRRIAARNDEATEALARIAGGDRKDWTPEAWADVLASLDACDQKLEDWIVLY